MMFLAGKQDQETLLYEFFDCSIKCITAQAAQAHYLWVRASEVIWSEYTRIISVLSDAK